MNKKLETASNNIVAAPYIVTINNQTLHKSETCPL